MTLIEFIGFIITMVVFFLLIAKQTRNDRRRRNEPEEVDLDLEQQQSQIKEILHALDLEAPEETLRHRKRPATPPPPPAENSQLSVEDDLIRIEERRRVSRVKGAEALSLIHPKGRVFKDVHKKGLLGAESIEVSSEEMAERQQASVRLTIAGKESLKRAVILREILGPPKGARIHDDSF